MSNENASLTSTPVVPSLLYRLNQTVPEVSVLIQAYLRSIDQPLDQRKTHEPDAPDVSLRLALMSCEVLILLEQMRIEVLDRIYAHQEMGTPVPSSLWHAQNHLMMLDPNLIDAASRCLDMHLHLSGSITAEDFFENLEDDDGDESDQP